MTQPNDTLSVRQIIENHTRGIPMSASDRYYDDPPEMDLSEYDQLDPFEKEMFLRDNRVHLEQIQKDLEEVSPRSSEPKAQDDDPAKPDIEAAKEQ